MLFFPPICLHVRLRAPRLCSGLGTCMARSVTLAAFRLYVAMVYQAMTGSCQRVHQRFLRPCALLLSSCTLSHSCIPFSSAAHFLHGVARWGGSHGSAHETHVAQSASTTADGSVHGLRSFRGHCAHVCVPYVVRRVLCRADLWYLASRSVVARRLILLLGLCP